VRAGKVRSGYDSHSQSNSKKEVRIIINAGKPSAAPRIFGGGGPIPSFYSDDEMYGNEEEDQEEQYHGDGANGGSFSFFSSSSSFYRDIEYANDLRTTNPSNVDPQTLNLKPATLNPHLQTLFTPAPCI